jgi:hypothetical protein
MHVVWESEKKNKQAYVALDDALMARLCCCYTRAAEAAQ